MIYKPEYKAVSLSYSFAVSAVSASTYSLSAGVPGIPPNGLRNMLHSVKIIASTNKATAATAAYVYVKDDAGSTLWQSADLGSAGATVVVTADRMLIGSISVMYSVNTATGVFTAGQTSTTATVVLYLM